MDSKTAVEPARPWEEKDEASAVASKKVVQGSLSQYAVKRSSDGLRGRGVAEKAAQVVLFVGKVVFLEALRRVGRRSKSCDGIQRPLMWTLQGIAGLDGLTAIQAPPFVWLQRLAPFRFLVRATEGFANPIIFLSLAGVVASAYKHKDLLNPDSRLDDERRKDLPQETVVTVSNTVPNTVSTTVSTTVSNTAPSTVPAVNIAILDPRPGDKEEEKVLASEPQEPTLEFLKQELDKCGVVLPQWFDDDLAERFWSAAHGDTSKLVANVKKTIRWRENYHFLTQSELRAWEHLVFWHKQDAAGRPALIIRLGLAFSTLSPSERPLFVQAILSQVEYGFRDKMREGDARLTVVMDCQGTSAIGFPLNMMKSCSVLVQENYPTRLAALYVINLPPIVQVLANTVLQVVKPSTKKKVHMEGDKYMNRLATSLGGIFDVPVVLGGRCSCDSCKDVLAREAKDVLAQEVKQNIPLIDLKAHKQLEQVRIQDLTSEEKAICLRQSTYESYSATLRVVITGLFILWIVVAMISGYGDTHAGMYPT